MLGGLDIVGSRWQQAALDSISLAAPVTTMTLNSVNSLDNADVYVPPFDPGQTRNGSQELTRREQSMSLEFTDLKPGATLETFKTFSLDENYSRYGKLSWYAAAFDLHDASGVRCDSTPGLFYFVRFASDEQGRNYYEYRASLPANSRREADLLERDPPPAHRPVQSEAEAGLPEGRPEPLRRRRRGLRGEPLRRSAGPRSPGSGASRSDC